jgi:small subunit ribosomal protein S3
MGQKANPIGLRIGINKGWDALWYAPKKHYAERIKEDMAIRSILAKQLRSAGVQRILIERPQKEPKVTIFAARPGTIVGKQGAGIESLLTKIKKAAGVNCSLDIAEVRDVSMKAQLVGLDIAQQMERRVSYKKAMKRSIQNVMRAGAQGVRISCSGRLGGVEIARTEWLLEGRVPLHTLKADIDFASVTAHTINGACGVKVWIYRGDILREKEADQDRQKKSKED